MPFRSTVFFVEAFPGVVLCAHLSPCATVLQPFMLLTRGSDHGWPRYPQNKCIVSVLLCASPSSLFRLCSLSMLSFHLLIARNVACDASGVQRRRSFRPCCRADFSHAASVEGRLVPSAPSPALQEGWCAARRPAPGSECCRRDVLR